MSGLSRDFRKNFLDWEKIKYKVIQRDNYRCTKCGAGNLQLYVHHKIPLSKGGTNDIRNLITLCENCYKRQNVYQATGKVLSTQVFSLPQYVCPSCGNEFLTPMFGHYCPKCGRHITDKDLKGTQPIDPKYADKGCFIATAAYGTATVEQIDVLREFRDLVLLKSTVGSRFVALYYRLSPPLADFIARNEVVKTLVRELLVDPIVWLVEATGDTWRS